MASRVLILAALAALAPAPARAQTSEKKKELVRIQSELKRTQEELESLRGEESALGQDVNRLQGLDADSQRRLLRLQETIRRAEAHRTDLKARLDAAGQVGGFWSSALAAETARHVAAASGRSDFMGSSELWAEEFRRLAIIEKARHVRGLKGYQSKAEEDEALARRKAEELAASRRHAQTERELRRLEYEAKKAQLEETQSKVAEHTRRVKELEESAAALNALLNKIARAERGQKVVGKAALDVPRNSLPWPVDGRVLLGYGRVQDPELGTWTAHQGLLIASARAAPVSAIAPGRVIFAGPFRSYGRVVILDHGKGFFSIYGSLGEILKEKGSEARGGEEIALAGSSATGAGGRVYLEIRRVTQSGPQALDPKAWLEKR